MAVLNVQKVNTLPGTLDSNACYMVKSAAPGLVDLYFTSNDATDIRHSVKSGDVSSYLYLDEQRPDGNGGWTVPTTPVTYNDYKYGLNNLSPISYVNNIGVDIIKSKLLNAKVHYMVSALDNNPADTSMGKSAE